MNNNSPPTLDSQSQLPESLPETPGSILRKAREAAKLTHTGVGLALHMTGQYIRFLEADDYSKLPGTTFVKGYLRAYGRFLQCDVDTLMSCYERLNANAADVTSRTESVSRNRRRHDLTIRWAFSMTVIVVIGLVAGWLFVGREQTAARDDTVTRQLAVLETTNSQALNSEALIQGAVAVVTPTAIPAATLVTTIMPLANELATMNASVVPNQAIVSAATPVQTFPIVAGGEAALASPATVVTSEQATEAPLNSNISIIASTNGTRQLTLTSEGSDLLQLIFRGNSWVEIDDASNVRLYNEMLSTGDTLNIHGTTPFHVLLGDASQVDVTLNANPIDLKAEIRNDRTARFILGTAAPAISPAPAFAAEINP